MCGELEVKLPGVCVSLRITRRWNALGRPKEPLPIYNQLGIVVSQPSPAAQAGPVAASKPNTKPKVCHVSLSPLFPFYRTTIPFLMWFMLILWATMLFGVMFGGIWMLFGLMILDSYFTKTKAHKGKKNNNAPWWPVQVFQEWATMLSRPPRRLTRSY